MSSDRGRCERRASGCGRGSGIEKMKIRIFTIPIWDDGRAVEDVNNFLAQHRVNKIEQQFVADGQNSQWTFCISYDDSKGSKKTPISANNREKIDYRDALSPDDFAIYVKLRTLRKKLAEEEGKPYFTVFTNEQLAEMVRRRVMTSSAMREIDGIGDARIEKYAPAFLEILQQAVNNETTSADTDDDSGLA